jgi:radical SAM protein with 4Fe4S-binding SPASM domain
MKYYGFNPFIQAYQDGKRGVLYDLLEGDIFEVAPWVVDLFSGKVYRSYEELRRHASKLDINEEELKRIIEEGKQNGIILELGRPYWRNEITQYMEFNKSQTISSLEFSTLWLQPTSKCDQNCSFCNSFINCTCFGGETEWEAKELENLFNDLERFKGMIGRVEIFGGNPLLYPGLETLLLRTCKINPKIINVNIPFSIEHWRLERLLKFKSICKTKFQITLLVFPAYNNISSIKEWKKKDFGMKFKLFLDQEEKRLEWMEKLDGISFSEEFILKKDLSNIGWFKEKLKDNFLESVSFFDFFSRKHWHRCWENSFSINSEGKVKPCLWSQFVFGNWEEGKVIDIIDNINTGKYYLISSSLEKIEGCRNCAYRFGCKDCRAITEFLTGDSRAKNPLCDK